MDRRKVITGLAAFGVLASIAAIVVTGLWPRLLVYLAAAIGIGPMLLYSLFIAYTNDHLRTEQMVAASSTLILVFGFGATLGPSTAGLLMDAFGPSGFLFLLGGAQAGIVAFALHRMRITRTGPVEAQSPWSMNPARTAALSPALAEVAADDDSDPADRADGPAR